VVESNSACPDSGRYLTPPSHSASSRITGSVVSCHEMACVAMPASISCQGHEGTTLAARSIRPAICSISTIHAWSLAATKNRKRVAASFPDVRCFYSRPCHEISHQFLITSRLVKMALS
jgi:hypothetical protein